MAEELVSANATSKNRAQSRQLFVALGCVISAGRVLLTQRYEPDQPELHLRWELPGGKVRPNEAPEVAVVREIREETGYEVEVTDPRPYGYTTPHWHYAEGRLRAVIHGYECRLVRPERITNWSPDPKVKAFEWCKLSELDARHILGGSRELILWIADRLGEASLLENMSLNSPSIFLEHRNPQVGSHKFYRLNVEITPGVLNAYTLSRYWGRFGRGAKTIQESIGTETQLRRRLKELITKRLSHGYTVKDMSQDFPLRSWVLSTTAQSPTREIQTSFIDDQNENCGLTPENSDKRE